MASTIEKHEFQAEAKQLLELMIHSVYSNKDIFLRELISNASDAMDKLRVESLADSSLAMTDDPEIRIERDEAGRKLRILDDGIGMNRDEVTDFIGTLAKSGTQEFLTKLKEAKGGESGASAELIGQFGVGFYSAFLVADRVTLTTRRAGQESATKWESTGDGTYTLEDSERAETGTTIELHLKEADDEDGMGDYVKEWKIREIVKKYSDFVTYPIRMDVERTEVERDDEGKPVEGAEEKKVVETETLNSMKAIWTRDTSDVDQTEYNEFYKHLSHDWTDPLSTFRFKAEGTFEYTMLLFFPSRAPMDLFYPEMKRGVHLYVKRVFIMDDCKDLVPDYLRFVKGVVDSEDLSLNISREILQQDRQIILMRNRLEKKVLSTLEEMKQSWEKSASKPESGSGDDGEGKSDSATAEDANDVDTKFLDFWTEFGKAFKEGIYREGDQRDRILALSLFATTGRDEDKLTSLSDYVGRMKDGQEKIYFMTGESRGLIESSPHLEAFKEKGYEVLVLTDPIDELWTGTPNLKYQEFEFESVGKGTAELGTEEEKKKKAEELEEKKETYSSLLECLQDHLGEEVKEVRLSNRLTDSAACLVGDEFDMTPQMEQLLRGMGQDPGTQKRILELNPNHPIMGTLQEMFSADSSDEKLQDYAELIFGQAVLAEGGKLSNPAQFSKLVTKLMSKGI